MKTRTLAICSFRSKKLTLASRNATVDSFRFADQPTTYASGGKTGQL